MTTARYITEEFPRLDDVESKKEDPGEKNQANNFATEECPLPSSSHFAFGNRIPLFICHNTAPEIYSVCALIIRVFVPHAASPVQSGNSNSPVKSAVDALAILA